WAVPVGLYLVNGHRPAGARLRNTARRLGLPRGFLLQRCVAFIGANPPRQRAGHASISAGNPLMDQPPWRGAAATDRDARPRIEFAVPDLPVIVRQADGGAPRRLRCFSPLSGGQFRLI